MVNTGGYFVPSQETALLKWDEHCRANHYRRQPKPDQRRHIFTDWKKLGHRKNKEGKDLKTLFTSLKKVYYSVFSFDHKQVVVSMLQNFINYYLDPKRDKICWCHSHLLYLKSCFILCFKVRSKNGHCFHQYSLVYALGKRLGCASFKIIMWTFFKFSASLLSVAKYKSVNGSNEDKLSICTSNNQTLQWKL